MASIVSESLKGLNANNPGTALWSSSHTLSPIVPSQSITRMLRNPADNAEEACSKTSPLPQGLPEDQTIAGMHESEAAYTSFSDDLPPKKQSGKTSLLDPPRNASTMSSRSRTASIIQTSQPEMRESAAASGLNLPEDRLTASMTRALVLVFPPFSPRTEDSVSDASTANERPSNDTGPHITEPPSDSTNTAGTEHSPISTRCRRPYLTERMHRLATLSA